MLLANMIVAVVIVYAVVFVVTDSAQRYLYDQVVDGLWWRALIVAVPLGAMLAAFPIPLDDLLVSFLWLAILEAVAWFLMLWLVCRYQPAHAAAVGIASYFLFSWIVNLSISSLATWLSLERGLGS